MRPVFFFLLLLLPASASANWGELEAPAKLWNGKPLRSLSTLPSGTHVEIRSKTTDNKGRKWALVKLGQVKGWVYAPYVIPSRKIRAKYTFTYSVKGLGVPSQKFSRQVREILNDPKGWSLGGRVRFVPVKGNGQVTIWLSPQRRIASLGCFLVRWSCQLRHEVVINHRRWMHGSQQYPGTLASYRRMLINHEFGHWLDFAHSNSYCSVRPSRRKRKAPVMMQQSSGLRGCRLNHGLPIPQEKRLFREKLKQDWQPTIRYGQTAAR